jgi:hypothetical protein
MTFSSGCVTGDTNDVEVHPATTDVTNAQRTIHRLTATPMLRNFDGCGDVNRRCGVVARLRGFGIESLQETRESHDQTSAFPHPAGFSLQFL